MTSLYFSHTFAFKVESQRHLPFQWLSIIFKPHFINTFITDCPLEMSLNFIRDKSQVTQSWDQQLKDILNQLFSTYRNYYKRSIMGFQKHRKKNVSDCYEEITLKRNNSLLKQLNAFNLALKPPQFTQGKTILTQ